MKINDFVVRFANVNGTGSASSNALFTKAVFRMGIPVTPKNIFPSNIQGLPTWYEVRVSEKGYLGRREGVDMMIAVNPQSMKKDYADVKAGGYFLYDSSKPLPPDATLTLPSHSIQQTYWRKSVLISDDSPAKTQRRKVSENGW